MCCKVNSMSMTHEKLLPSSILSTPYEIIILYTVVTLQVITSWSILKHSKFCIQALRVGIICCHIEIIQWMLCRYIEYYMYAHFIYPSLILGNNSYQYKSITSNKITTVLSHALIITVVIKFNVIVKQLTSCGHKTVTVLHA